MARYVFRLGGYSLRLSARYERSSDGSLRRRCRVLYSDQEGHHCLWDESAGPQAAPTRSDQIGWAEALDYLSTRAQDWFDEAWRVSALVADSVVEAHPANRRPLTIESSAVIVANQTSPASLVGSHFRAFWGSRPGADLGHEGVFTEALTVPYLGTHVYEPIECFIRQSRSPQPGRENILIDYHPVEILSLARATAALVG